MGALKHYEREMVQGPGELTAERNKFNIKLIYKIVIKSYPQVGLGAILCVVYNVNQVGKSGKRVNNIF